MKKMVILALVLTMGFMVGMEASAATIGVPWFVDNAGAARRIPPTDGATTTLIYLNNGSASDLTCMIAYYTQDGVAIGPFTNNTFVVPALSTVAFRPVADDPATVAGGQEAEIARLVPNRPLGTTGGNDNKKNGSIQVQYDNTNGNITGKAESFQHSIADPADSSKGYATLSYSYTLPQP